MDTTTTKLGNLTITRKDRCNRIDVLPWHSGYFTHFLCANCGRDLEVTTGAAGFHHLPTFVGLDREATR